MFVSVNGGRMPLKVMIHYLREPEGPDTEAYCFSNPTVEVSSLKEARDLAFKQANEPTMGAHSVIVETDDGATSERWVRGANGWSRRP